MTVDFHCHPSFKTFLGSARQGGRKSAWTNLRFMVHFGILNSQSSLKQIQNGRAGIAVAGLYGLERAFAEACLIRWAAGLSRHASLRFIKDIADGKFGYHDLMQGDLEHLLASNQPPDKAFTILNSFSEYDPQSSIPQIILSVEGGHNFYADGQAPGKEKDILAQLEYFKQPGNPRLLYLTLTHLTNTVFATHAYGMKIISNAEFEPKGRGLTGTGKRLIRKALDDTDGRLILIDVKHLSIQARRDYYAMRRKAFPDVPIMASHMGLTGVSWHDKPVKRVRSRGKTVEVYYYRSLGYMDTYFNPWSINLYDEDIREIVASRGLICLSLDKRILGFGNVSSEIFSAEEYDPGEFKRAKRPRYHTPNHEAYRDARLMKEWHVRYLCNQVVHAVKVGGPAAWDCLAIGSDFDGLIDPLANCQHAGQFPGLFGDMVVWLPHLARAAGIPLADHEVQPRVRQILFENGLAFLKRVF